MLPLPCQRRIQLEAMVEMVLHSAFAAPGHDDDVLDPRRDRLFHAVLDDGLVHQRQHLLGNHFGGRQKARAQPTRRKNRYSPLLAHLIALILITYIWVPWDTILLTAPATHLPAAPPAQS